MPQEVSSSSSENVCRLDHLGIIAGICDEIGLVELVDSSIGVDPRYKVSNGVALKAMILNGLGFTQRTLYLTPEFFRDKPVSHLLGECIEAVHLHDDCLGRCLDALYNYGLSKLFFRISIQAHMRYNIPIVSKHLDGTSLSVHGSGNSSEDAAVRVVPGYNKQGRHYLPQVVLELLCNGSGGLPLFMEVFAGNENDKTAFPKAISNYLSLLSWENMEDDSLLVADNCLYTAKTVGKLKDIYWLSRAGHNLSWVKKAYLRSEHRSWKDFANHPNYRYQTYDVNYGDTAQVALIIHSKSKYKQDLLKFESRLQKVYSSYKERLLKLGKRSFSDRKSALKAAHNFSKKGSTYYSLCDIKIEKIDHYGPGRRGKDTQPIRQSYKIAADIVEKPKAIKSARAALGKFVLATNEIVITDKKGKKHKKSTISTEEPQINDSNTASVKREQKDQKSSKEASEKTVNQSIKNNNNSNNNNNNNNKEKPSNRSLKRSADEYLELYKDSQQTAERGFRFIKDPVFQLCHFFVQLPRRIMALTMVMCTCLLVYCLAEFKLRKSMEQTEDTLPNQVGKQVSNPTMRWVFRLFRGLHLQHTGQDSWYLLGLNDLHRKVLSHLDPTVGAYYGL